MPVLSIILCVRDGERFVKAALDSIAKQEMEDVETLVIDGASRDRSREIAADHALRPRVVIEAEPGQPVALNRGIALAQGPLLSFIDCDDVWPAGRLAALNTAIKANPRVDGAFGRMVNTDRTLRPIGRPIAARLHTTMVIKRAAAERVGPFRTDIRHAIILDWIGRLDRTGSLLAPIEDVVLLRRVHGENLGIREAGAARRDMMMVLRDHLARKTR